MSKNLHITPKEPLIQGQKWNAKTGHLLLSKAGTFEINVSIKKDFYKNPKHPKPEPFEKLSKEDYEKMSYLKRVSYERELKSYEEKQLYYEHSLQKLREAVRWCWEVVGKGMEGRTFQHNNSFSKGLSSDLGKQVKFPKLLEGGAPAWLEIFTDKDPATGKLPDGIFVSAIGTPKIIAAEWRDYTGKLITEEVAFGSTVYLHIYTEALYGQNIEIQLVDDGFITDTNLTPTPSDDDGNPVQKLDPKRLTRFTREVKTHKFNDLTKPPAGSITNAMVTEKGKEQFSVSNVQKCVFPVFIEPAWQFQAQGNFDSGKSLNIKPIVCHSKIKNQKIDLDDCVLKVSRNGILMQGELKGNNPLILGEDEKSGAPEEQNKIDFTFGVFIDGTNNNRYDTIARTSWEENRIGRKATDETPYTSDEHLKVYAKSKNEVSKKDNYKYGEGSYENDLSNVAILFDNYLEDKKKRVFKIYTEGMNTNTLGDENLNVSKYEKDDIMEGGAMGIGNAGIIDRVRRAVEQVVNKMEQSIGKSKNKIGSLTIDVFGFSRGAASARHFVHTITYPAYYATAGIKGAYCDHQGYQISEEYQNRKKILPTNGYLGYLMTEKGLKFDQLTIRFAGLYDTVAHHGLVQYNDIRDLGLNSISKAKYIVHMVAGEEHRKNFSLSPIIKSQNHIELYLPGVHCDVGGSYTEGRPEGIAPGVAPDPDGEHVLAKDYCDNTLASARLTNFRNILMQEGWFTKDQITICDAFSTPYKYDPARSSRYDTQQLISQRAYISNQYSFIPLHMMCNFAIEREVKLDFTKLKDSKDFKKNIFSEHLNFITKIKAYLEDYATKAMANPLLVINHKIPNEDMKQLRNHYLHYNATVGIVNGPEPERKRDIIQP